ncbi:hypothetical protein GCM10028808_73130 [Spirosoma migulaei]
MASEKRKPTEQSKEALIYKNIKVGDDYATLKYEFNSNKLVSLTYSYTKLGGILYMPYISFSAIDRKVTERYGEPIQAKEKWYGNESDYKKPIGYSDAVVKGDLSLTTTWITERTSIVHLMQSDIHGLAYASRLTPKPASENTKDF